MKQLAVCVLLTWAAVTQAVAQDWSFLAPLTAQTLDVRPGDSAPLLFSDHPDPGVAQHSVIFHYFDSRSGGNSFGLNVGLYRRDQVGWRYIQTLEIFGVDPRDGVFHGDRFEVVTLMLGPNEPRCCPTQQTRWVVDLRGGQVYRQ